MLVEYEEFQEKDEVRTKLENTTNKEKKVSDVHLENTLTNIVKKESVM